MHFSNGRNSPEMYASPSMNEYDEVLRAEEERREIVSKYDKGREEGAQIDPWEDPAFEVYHVLDRWGFIHDHRLPEGRDAAEKKAIEIEREREKKWMKMINKWEQYYPGEKIVRRIYKGIPASLRGLVWARILSIHKTREEQNGVYMAMRNRARKKSPHIRQIDIDVNRTYRNHIMFRERYGVKQKALFHVLAAYSTYNTEVGYCQGMSEIAALLLMYLNEEEAFWGLSQLFCSKQHGMHGLFIPGFPKLLRYQEHHDVVLKKFLPKVRKYFERNDIYPSLYTIKWFLQCFLGRIPFTLTLRLWDIFILEGEKILTAMAYNIIKLHRRKLMRMGPDEILQFFQTELEKNFGYDDDTIIDQLQITVEELRKAKMDFPPRPKVNEEPTLPFGLEIEPSIEQILKGRNPETIDEHFKRNPHKGKAGYLKRRGLNNAATPEMPRSRTDSSRLSEYSMDDTSTYYDTAANSRISFSKASMQSSRTSYADDSDMEGLRQMSMMDDLDEQLVGMENGHPSRDTTIENIAEELRSPSVHSDYDNMGDNKSPNTSSKASFHDAVETTLTEVPVHHEVSIHIPASKSDGFIKSRSNMSYNQNSSNANHDVTMEDDSYRQGAKSANDINSSPSKYVSKLKVQTDHNGHPNGYTDEDTSRRNVHNSSKLVVSSANFNQRLVSKHQIQIKTSQL
ncbi:USP6 N-terminal-like protein isoform X4 [Ostrea edulis]|uniref:USP6 N-terminal-like protein isoform X4 n=1 Tax=Ostrea edulis TaxID=37623 RepID=UPI0024AFD06C|nr:USP6 N-terminal-like protein isoform X4 [Ostrea edulis]